MMDARRRLVRVVARWLVPLAMVAICVAVVRAGQTAPQVFRADARLVPIDVRVVDRQGRPVTDLTVADFTLLEDGVPQDIRHLTAQAFTDDGPVMRGASAPAPGAPSAVPSPEAPDPALAPQSSRVFLVMLGRGRLQVPNRGIDGVRHLVTSRLLPQDRVSLLAYNRATDFTTDHGEVAQVIDRYMQGHASIEVQLAMHFSGLAGMYRPPGIPAFLQPEIDTIFDGPGSPRMRTMLAEAAPEDPSDAAHRRRVTDTLMSSPGTSEFSPFDRAEAEGAMPGFGDYIANQSFDAADMANIRAGIDYLRHIPGEKHLIYVAYGGLTMPVAGIGRAASDARVAVHVIHTGGIGMPPMQMVPQIGPQVGPGGSPWDTYLYRGTSIFTAMQARELAAETGGTFYANQHRLAAGDIDAMDRATRFQYTLGYYPDSTTLDGRYRRIEVRVNRPGVTVHYRRGYNATPPPPSFDRREMLSYTRIARAFAYEHPISDLIVTGEAAWAPRSGDGRRVDLRAAIATAGVALDTDDTGRRVGALEVAVFLLDRRDRQVGDLWQRVELNLSDATYTRFQSQGIPYTATLDAPADARAVKVVVYDYASDLVGTTVVPIGGR